MNSGSESPLKLNPVDPHRASPSESMRLFFHYGSLMARLLNFVANQENVCLP